MTPTMHRTHLLLRNRGPATVTEVATVTRRTRTGADKTLRALEREGLAWSRLEDGPGGPQLVYEARGEGAPPLHEQVLTYLRERREPVPFSEVREALGPPAEALRRLRDRGLAVNLPAGWVAGEGEAWEAARQLGLEHWRLYAWLAEQHEPVRQPEGAGSKKRMRELREAGAVIYLGGGLWVAG